MPVLEQSLCTMWATIADVCAPCNVYDLDPALLEEKLLVASEVLYNLTFRQWPGVCTDTVRPCAAYGGRGGGDFPWWSGQTLTRTGGGGNAWGFCGCHRDTSCGCYSISSLALPRWPVVSVASVKIDGAVLDPAFYRVDDHRRLTYLPGDSGEGWPCCQYLDRASTEDGTFEVSYRYGKHPPLAGVHAAAALGCQLVLAVTNSSACQLPKRVQSITRQGVTATLIDNLAGVQDGWTGLFDVDLFIASVRKARKDRGGAVYDPQRSAGFRRPGV